MNFFILASCTTLSVLCKSFQRTLSLFAFLELFSISFCLRFRSFSKADAKVVLFPLSPKLSPKKVSIFLVFIFKIDSHQPSTVSANNNTLLYIYLGLHIRVHTVVRYYNQKYLTTPCHDIYNMCRANSSTPSYRDLCVWTMPDRSGR